MMEPVRIAAEEFEARCLELLEEVAEGGVTLIVTVRDEPVARVVPMSVSGELFGSVVREDDIVSPAGEDWNASS